MASYVRRDIVGGAPATTLTSDPGSGGTTIAIASGTGWPTGSNGNFYICIDRGHAGEEKVLCSSRSGTNLTVAAAGRGSDGTSAAAHAVGVTVEHVISAVDADEANYTVSKTVGKATATGQILVADGANSFAAVQGKTSGQVLLGNGTTVVSQALTGDVTVNGSGVTAIGSSKVTSAMIVDATIATGDIANSAITTALINDGAVTAAKLASGVGGVTVQTTAPSGSAGQLWFDSDDFLLHVYSQGAWVCITPKSALVATLQSTTSTSFTDLSTSGPAVSLLTGTSALVTLGAYIDPGSGTKAAYMGFAVSGASTVAAATTACLFVQNDSGGLVTFQASRTVLVTGLTAGTNTFTAKYEATSGSTANFRDRTITVVGIP